MLYYHYANKIVDGKDCKNNSAEYIKKGESPVITSHGHGSGIYFISEERVSRMSGMILDYNFEYVVEMDQYNMYRIGTQKVDKYNEVTIQDLFSSFSMQIMRCINNLIQHSDIFSATDVFNNVIEDMNKMYSDVDDIINKLGLTKQNIITGIEKFLTEYRLSNEIPYVEMPINYILKEHGYMGVLCEPLTYGDSFSRGSVLFETGECICIRTGTSQECIDNLLYNTYNKLF